ncbi:MAG: carboxypeptidase-like regulatory domain-containing protein [Thermoanaerobaculia bacterium]
MLDTGNLYANVTDEQSSPLPGVTVTLTGVGASQYQVTDQEGRTMFLGLPPGKYSAAAQLEGFTTVKQPNVNIDPDRNTFIETTLISTVE